MELINPNSVSRPDSKDKTADDVLEMVRARLKKQSDYLRGEIDSPGATLLVKRTNGLNLAIKIANETWKLAPMKEGTPKALAKQIDKASELLNDYKAELFHFYQWVASNVGKKKADRTPYEPMKEVA